MLEWYFGGLTPVYARNHMRLIYDRPDTQFNFLKLTAWVTITFQLTHNKRVRAAVHLLILC